MIDTDKYEGITPERWTVDEEDPCRVVDAQECTIARTDFVDIDEEREWQLANAQLIADAPLILEDYERLRKEVMFLVNLEEFSTDERYIIQMEAEVKRLRKRNAWLEEVVGLAVEFDHIDLSDEGWPQWEGEEE